MPSLMLARAFVLVLLLGLHASGAAPPPRPDTCGVPHVVGETEEASLFGYGYPPANDGWGHLLIVMEGRPEDPTSPHYNDQARLHSRRQVKRFWFAPEEILAHTGSVRGKRGRIRALLKPAAVPANGQE